MGLTSMRDTVCVRVRKNGVIISWINPTFDPVTPCPLMYVVLRIRHSTD